MYRWEDETFIILPVFLVLACSRLNQSHTGRAILLLTFAARGKDNSYTSWTSCAKSWTLNSKRDLELLPRLSCFSTSPIICSVKQISACLWHSMKRAVKCQKIRSFWTVRTKKEAVKICIALPVFKALRICRSKKKEKSIILAARVL